MKGPPEAPRPGRGAARRARRARPRRGTKGGARSGRNFHEAILLPAHNRLFAGLAAPAPPFTRHVDALSECARRGGVNVILRHSLRVPRAGGRRGRARRRGFAPPAHPRRKNLSMTLRQNYLSFATLSLPSPQLGEESAFRRAGRGAQRQWDAAVRRGVPPGGRAARGARRAAREEAGEQLFFSSPLLRAAPLRRRPTQGNGAHW